MKLPRSVVLAYLDFSDSLRLGLFDAVIFIFTFVGVLLSYLEYYGSSASLAMSILSPTLLATALYLALRSSAGIAHMAGEGVLDIYLTYPLSRPVIALVILISRVIVPSLIIIGLPALAASIVYYPLISAETLKFLEMFGAFLVQATFYGVSFSVIALLSKRGGTASILSLLYYFTYNILELILSNLSATYESITYKISRAMSFYLVAYQHVNPPSIVPPPSLWEALLVPGLTLVLGALFVLHFSRWYEP
ncbi:MAG: hypothetical protein F7C35_00770 [Desulfurococcales archaeon]|nr:hypothetical protein [Desulfurococcales archaeon]